MKSFFNFSYVFIFVSVYGLLEELAGQRGLTLILDLQTPDLLVETYRTLLSIVTSDNIISCGNLLVECLAMLVDASDEMNFDVLDIFMNNLESQKDSV
jgi:hypothetical protein